jgi:hypothetical protein
VKFRRARWGLIRRDDGLDLSPVTRRGLTQDLG